MTWPPSIVHDIPERLSRCVKTILQAASVMPDPRGNCWVRDHRVCAYTSASPRPVCFDTWMSALPTLTLISTQIFGWTRVELSAIILTPILTPRCLLLGDVMEPPPKAPSSVWSFPFTEKDREQTPPAVQAYLHTLRDEMGQLQERVENAEVRLKQNSTTSALGRRRPMCSPPASGDGLVVGVFVASWCRAHEQPK